MVSPYFSNMRWMSNGLPSRLAAAANPYSTPTLPPSVLSVTSAYLKPQSLIRSSWCSNPENGSINAKQPTLIAIRQPPHDVCSGLTAESILPGEIEHRLQVLGLRFVEHDRGVHDQAGLALGVVDDPLPERQTTECCGAPSSIAKGIRPMGSQHARRGLSASLTGSCHELLEEGQAIHSQAVLIGCQRPPDSSRTGDLLHFGREGFDHQGAAVVDLLQGCRNFGPGHMPAARRTSVVLIRMDVNEVGACQLDRRAQMLLFDVGVEGIDHELDGRAVHHSHQLNRFETSFINLMEQAVE